MMCNRSNKGKAWRIISAAVAVALMAAGCGGSSAALSGDTDTDDGIVQVLGEQEEADTTEVIDSGNDVAGSEPSDELSTEPVDQDAPTPVEGQDGNEPPSPIVPELDDVNDPGQATVDFLGTEMTFEFGVPWKLTDIGDGAFVIAEPTSEVPFGPLLIMFRPTGFASEEELTHLVPQFGSNFEAWLTHAPVDLVADAQTTIVGGQPAVVLDLQLSDEASPVVEQCGPPPQDRCVSFASTTANGILSHVAIRSGRLDRIWIVEQDEFAPIVIVASAPLDMADWVDDIFQPVVESITLGQPQQAPREALTDKPWEQGHTAPVPIGELMFPVLGGITLDLPVEAIAMQDGECLLFNFGPEGGAILAEISQDVEGNRIATVQDYQALNGDVISRTESGRTMDFRDSELIEFNFQVDGELTDPMISCAPVGENTSGVMSISPFPYGTEWLVETSDGVYLFGVATPDQDLLAEMTERFDAMLESMTPVN